MGNRPMLDAIFYVLRRWFGGTCLPVMDRGSRRTPVGDAGARLAVAGSSGLARGTAQGMFALYRWLSHQGAPVRR